MDADRRPGRRWIAASWCPSPVSTIVSCRVLLVGRVLRIRVSPCSRWRNRALAARGAPHARSPSGKTSCAALCLLPALALVPRADRARPRRCCWCWASSARRLRTRLFIRSLRVLSRAYRERGGGAGARLRHRAGRRAAGRGPDARTMLGDVLIVGASSLGGQRRGLPRERRTT